MIKMINPKILKTYDIRGKYPNEINEAVVADISRRIRRYFESKNSNKKIKIIIGRDSRLSSPALYRAAIKAIMNNESKIKNKKSSIYKIGMATTPMFYFLADYFNADFGIMITASHNPKEYNGLKIIGKHAIPESPVIELKRIFTDS